MNKKILRLDPFAWCSWQRGIFSGSLLASACLLSLSVFADQPHSDMDGEGYGEGALLISLEVVNIVIAFIAAIVVFNFAHRTNSWKQAIGVRYIGTGIALLGMTRVFYILADNGIIFIHDDTLEFWWHIIFFAAMTVFIIGGQVLSTLNLEEESWLNTPQALRFWIAVCSLITVAAFLTAEPLDKPFVAAFDGSLMDKLGVQHLAAFVFAGIAVLHAVVVFGVSEVSTDVGIAQRLKTPLIIGYGLFALDHFWELLFESWEVLALSETLIEQTEQVIVFPAFLAFLYAGWRLRTHDLETQPPVTEEFDPCLARQRTSINSSHGR